MTTIESLFSNSEFTEIIVNGASKLSAERNGRLESYNSPWVSQVEYQQYVRSVLDQLNADLSLHNPFCSGRVGEFRVQVAGPPVTSEAVISFRRLMPRRISLREWTNSGGLTEQASEVISEAIANRNNILVFGATGSGKTTLLSSLLGEVKSQERVLLLEDIEELQVPNDLSLRLLTRTDSAGVLREVTLSDLVKNSLRLRPDRLALGEVRGPEAKDLLMALATGHRGSFGTIHAHSFNECLLRLELLVQLGAPQWQTMSIRKLIFLSLHILIGVQKNSKGVREVKEVHRLTGLEDFGFLSEKLY